MKIEPYKVKQTEDYEGGRYARFETRYRIVDDAGKVIDDAQGYGYRSADKARAAHWYKTVGRQQQQDKERSARKWLRQYPALKRAYLDMTEFNFKELMRGEVKMKEIFEDLERQIGATIPDDVRWFLQRSDD